jgi:sporulation protein YlmC with PRC-barrel domain
VKLTKKGGEKETYYINQGDYSLVKKLAVSKNAELENAMLETYYNNYNSVGGISIPYTAVSKVNDQTILTITIKKARINVPLPPNFFKN